MFRPEFANPERVEDGLILQALNWQQSGINRRVSYKPCSVAPQPNRISAKVGFHLRIGRLWLERFCHSENHA